MSGSWGRSGEPSNKLLQPVVYFTNEQKLTIYSQFTYLNIPIPLLFHLHYGDSHFTNCSEPIVQIPRQDSSDRTTTSNRHDSSLILSRRQNMFSDRSRSGSWEIIPDCVCPEWRSRGLRRSFSGRRAFIDQAHHRTHFLTVFYSLLLYSRITSLCLRCCLRRTSSRHMGQNC